MPYACTIVGGHPNLVPSEERSYRVVGLRERQQFQACSPQNPGQCRSWTLHRFELTCDGVKVPWVAVVAAEALRQQRRARLENGRFHLQMGRWWNGPPQDACARADLWRYPQIERLCNNRAAIGAPRFVEIPSGFAPAFGLAIRFVSVTSPLPVSVSSQGRPAVVSTGPETALARRKVSAPHPSAKRPEASHAALAPAPGDPPAIQAAPSAAKKAVDGVPGLTSFPKRTAPSPIASEKIAEKPTAEPVATSPKLDQLSPAGNTSPRPAAEIAVSDVHNLLWALFAALVVGLAGAVVALRRARLPHVPGTMRDFASATLWTEPARPVAADAVRTARLQVYSTPHLGAKSIAQVAPSPRGVLATVPATLAEAQQVLGMGISDTASEAAIKKIVDGLRQSWHPDHANSEIDREEREVRSKQINAAWDIIRGKRAEV